jgi:hypothetical protein
METVEFRWVKNNDRYVSSLEYRCLILLDENGVSNEYTDWRPLFNLAGLNNAVCPVPQIDDVEGQ